ncbi:MAG: hypothetical protein H8D46_02015, partial [FCB group bacterium]|nr:hypothetical protein [FCB group bacterium]
IAYNSDKRVSIQDVDVFLKEASMVTRKIDVDHLIYLWDAVFLAGKQINRDAIGMFTEKAGIVHPSVIMVNEEMIFLGRGSRINAGVVLDASEGPIIISDHVKIDIGALIKGPAVIGAKSVINPAARLRGNVILGPVCKVGGELEDVVIQGYSNKQHDGFLGHSYLGEWVNLGAGTNNSDLKNNYGKIRFDFGDDQVDSGLTFLGAMIGDYVKTGIATMLNTGTYIGTGANVFGGGFQRKHIPAFSWGENDRAQLSKFLKTCEIMKVRRGMILSETEKELLTACYGRMKPL